MDCCLVLPCAKWGPRSRLGYRRLTEDGFGGDESNRPVMVVVGKEKRVFMVEPFVLEENPFRVLIETMKNSKGVDGFEVKSKKRVIFVDVDAILFEHMLWLMYNDCSSLFKLNVREVIDFYAQDI